jgi:uncharacterized protein YutE (UPF0331/DUF86 family)
MLPLDAQTPALGAPETPAAAFQVIGRHGIIDMSLAGRLAQAAGLHNLIVHRYGDLDITRLVEAVSRGLANVNDFAARLRAYASRKENPV